MDPHSLSPTPHPSHNLSPTPHPPHSLSPTPHLPHSIHDNVPYTCCVNIASSGNTSALAEMLSNIDALDVIPKLQVETYTEPESSSLLPIEPSTAMTVPDSTPIIIPLNPPAPNVLSLPRAQGDCVASSSNEQTKTKPRVGRPRTKQQKEKTEWHYHLGGMRHSRKPLSPKLREVLEVAYVSKIMSKNFRKEGQPEKERIANITGMKLDKVQEWFKNRRKKDRLQNNRHHFREKQSQSEGQHPSNSYDPEPSSHHVTPIQTSDKNSPVTASPDCELHSYL